MTLQLRIILFAVSALTMIMIIKRVRTSRMRIDDAVFWIVFSFLLLILSIFPKIIWFISDLAGIETPANFLFILIFFVLIIRLFQLNIKLSQLESKMQELVQRIAVDETLKRETVEKVISKNESGSLIEDGSKNMTDSQDMLMREAAASGTDDGEKNDISHT